MVHGNNTTGFYILGQFPNLKYHGNSVEQLLVSNNGKLLGKPWCVGVYRHNRNGNNEYVVGVDKCFK